MTNILTMNTYLIIWYGHGQNIGKPYNLKAFGGK
jgi:hypothetical protein